MIGDAQKDYAILEAVRTVWPEDLCIEFDKTLVKLWVRRWSEAPVLGLSPYCLYEVGDYEGVAELVTSGKSSKMVEAHG